MHSYIKDIITAALALTASAATAADVAALPDRQRAAYCSGVLAQQSLLFRQLSAIYERNGQADPAKRSLYDSKQLYVRARILERYGDDKQTQTRAFKETGKVVQRAKDEKRNPVGSFYGLTKECMEFYKSKQDTPEIQELQRQVSAEARKEGQQDSQQSPQ